MLPEASGTLIDTDVEVEFDDGTQTTPASQPMDTTASHQQHQQQQHQQQQQQQQPISTMEDVIKTTGSSAGGKRGYADGAPVSGTKTTTTTTTIGLPSLADQSATTASSLPAHTNANSNKDVNSSSIADSVFPFMQIPDEPDMQAINAMQCKIRLPNGTTISRRYACKQQSIIQ